jgi:YfiR/HmsC-like
MDLRSVAASAAGLLLALLVRNAPVASAQEVAVPVAVQVPILVKVLSFDRRLPERAADRLVIGVLFQSGYRTSANVAEEVCRQVQELPPGAFGALDGRPIACLGIDLDATAALDSALRKSQVHVLYVSPLRATPLRDVIAASRAVRVTTLTGVPRYVESGLAIGVDMKGDRPEIVVNLAASRAEGADLTAHLLKLARVVGDDTGGGR